MSGTKPKVAASVKLLFRCAILSNPSKTDRIEEVLKKSNTMTENQLRDSLDAPLDEAEVSGYFLELFERLNTNESEEIRSLLTKFSPLVDKAFSDANNAKKKAKVEAETPKKTCKAITKAGTQCSRVPKEGSEHCSTHAKMLEEKAS